MNKYTIFKLKDRILACSVKFILVDRIIGVLPGKLVLQFHGNDWNTVEKQHDINAVFVIGRIVKLSGTVQNIALILRLRCLIDRCFGLPVYYTECNTSVLKAVAKNGKQPERSNLLAKTVNKRLFGGCAVYRLILLPRFRLSGFYEGDQRSAV